MALVDYSDSEGEGEGKGEVVPASKPTLPATKPIFHKAAPGKLQVNLPSLKPEPGQSTDGTDGPPAKRVRTGGAFSGFNALLPAPKKAVAQSSLKKGVSLKTSGEAAFSRSAPPPQFSNEDADYTPITSDAPATDISVEKNEEAAPEPKLLGKSTRFLPLSVSGKKKKKPIAKSPEAAKVQSEGNDVAATEPVKAANTMESSKPKPKRSLFSMSTAEEAAPAETNGGEYEPITIEQTSAAGSNPYDNTPQDAGPTNPNSLEFVADDMNLTAAQRRQLFGRGGKDVNVMHFNLDAQYKENERARQAGEVVEHRAVKAVAAGKHSLQQLVNNAKSQQEGLQDKWAEGRRARGEGGSKYGWSQ